MTTKQQIILSAALVAAAAATVGVYTLADANGNEDASAAEADAGGGHVHGAAAPAAADAGPIVLDEEGARRIGVVYTTAQAKPFRASVRTVGNVGYDETRLATVDPKVEGWVERLYVDFTGAPVRRGAPLLAIYSPMIVTAQEELILARRLLDNAGDADGRAAANARELLEAARRRLGYWDISESEIERIERAGTPQRTVTLASPASGVVVEKNVVAGSRVMPGMPLYRIADLSRVWVEGEVFERDLGVVRVGQRASVTVDAYPGEVFAGRVAYVYPSVSLETRTGRVRIELDNPGMRLMPGMYARVELEAATERQALLIPRDAVHATGERDMVFVRDAAGALHARTITTGLIAGTEIEVLSGLRAGEQIVSSAAFLVDAESSMGGDTGSMAGMEH